MSNSEIQFDSYKRLLITADSDKDATREGLDVMISPKLNKYGELGFYRIDVTTNYSGSACVAGVAVSHVNMPINKIRLQSDVAIGRLRANLIKATGKLSLKARTFSHFTMIQRIERKAEEQARKTHFTFNERPVNVLQFPMRMACEACTVSPIGEDPYEVRAGVSFSVTTYENDCVRTEMYYNGKRVLTERPLTEEVFKQYQVVANSKPGNKFMLSAYKANSKSAIPSSFTQIPSGLRFELPNSNDFKAISESYDFNVIVGEVGYIIFKLNSNENPPAFKRFANSIFLVDKQSANSVDDILEDVYNQPEATTVVPAAFDDDF